MKIGFPRFVAAGAAAFGCAFGAFADGVSVTPGCDFTNAVMRVTAAQDASINITLNGASVSPTSSSYVGSEYVYNLAVSAGSVYDYAVTINDGTPIKGEFLAANMKDGFASSATVNTNGSWSPALVFDDNVATVTGATFTVSTALPNSKVVVVENVVSFVDGFEEEDLAELSFTGAQAMVVVVTNTANETQTLEWRAWFGGTAPTSLDGWTLLTGVTPASETDYTVRTEFDYTTEDAPKVSVLVKQGAGDFVRLANGGNTWFSLSDTSKTTLSKVDICGNVAFSSMVGKTSNANLFTDGTTEYASAAAALASGKALTLLADASVSPTARGKWSITTGGYTLTPYGTDALQCDYEGGILRAYAAKEAKIGTAEYVFLDEAFAAAEDNATVTLLTDVTTTAATILEKPLSLDLAGHNYLPTGALTLGTNPFIITNTVKDAGCVKFASLTDKTSSLKVAGGLWVNETYGLAKNFTYYALATPVECDGSTFAYQAKQSEELVVGGDTVKVEEDFIAKYVPDAKTIEAKVAALTADRTEGNCLPLIQSYALSLNPNDVTAKPIATAVPNDAAAKMTLSLGNVRVNTGCGLPVKFALKTSSSPDMTGVTPGDAQTEPSFTVDLPTSKADGNVKYYAIDIQFGNN